ncbi:MAG TPA: hypothetical protein VN026_11230 [Bacteroidia bacterium]|jgi:hypothetical protein|nr:hypothetical protein [Bacteroidia bacterium]
MKKLISALFVCLAVSGFSQVSFEQKAKVIDVNANFGVYNTISSDSTARANGTTHSDKAAPYGFALGFEYGVLNWLGIGLKGQLCTYLTSKDAATGQTPKAQAKDLMLVINTHLLRKKHINLLAGFDFGYSGFKFSSNDTKNSIAKGGGYVYDLHLTPRLYFTNHLGMYMNLSYIGYGYPGLKISDNDRKYTDHLKFTANGVNVAIGFQVRF